MSAAVSRRLDDEGLPLPPPVHGRVSGVLLRVLVYGEKAMFIAIALTLLVIAVVVFVGDCRSWCWPRLMRLSRSPLLGR
jgi:hypothetical protein